MKIVVIGGTGLIGRKAVELLQEKGHEVFAASPSTGVNAVTGEGVADALRGADVVVDVPNAPSFEDDAVREFFERSATNLAAAEKEAGVRHHVVLSIVGADRIPDIGYMRAKVLQEGIVRESGVPFTIVRATQFHEFIETLTGAYAADGVVKVPDIDFQPIAADDVAAALVEAALGGPRNGTVDLAGPERGPFESFIRTYLDARGDARPVKADEADDYFGAPVVAGSLVPGGDYIKGAITIAEWLRT